MKVMAPLLAGERAAAARPLAVLLPFPSSRIVSSTDGTKAQLTEQPFSTARPPARLEHGGGRFSRSTRYDTRCYLPVVATVTFDDETAQYAVAAVLRPGTAPASLGTRGLLRRQIRHQRDAPFASTIRVPLDGGAG
jgi:hypothetical protein